LPYNVENDYHGEGEPWGGRRGPISGEKNGLCLHTEGQAMRPLDVPRKKGGIPWKKGILTHPMKGDFKGRGGGGGSFHLSQHKKRGGITRRQTGNGLAYGGYVRRQGESAREDIRYGVPHKKGREGGEQLIVKSLKEKREILPPT